MRFLSLFDGCGMFSHALRNVGMACAGTSEIEDHPRAVTRYHYPHTPQLGDVRNVTPASVGPIDLVLGGWPCQGNSVAGSRGGMDDPRSGLFGEVVRVARETSARWILLENVPGLLSVRGGRDMGAVVGALGELGYGLAWRVLDAQHFGVAQRRRRVFFVGYRGDAGRAGSVLFEPEGMPGDSEAGREARARVASRARGGAAGGRRWPARIASTLDAAFGDKQGLENQHIDAGAPLFIVSDLVQVTSKHNRSTTRPGSPAPTLAATGRPAVFNWRGHDSAPADRHYAPCLDTCNAGSLATNTPGVRRLMPLECERLQGLPDGWTARGRKPDGTVYDVADGPRYKMIGNGGAVPVVEWIGRRIMREDTRR